MESAEPAAKALQHYPRILDRYDGQEPGALLICMGGMHGNEPSGVLALRRIFDRLRENQIPIRGSLLGLCGNLRALAVGERFLDRDLNRAWKRTRVEKLDELQDNCAETLEQRELLKVLRDAVDGHEGPVYFLDLHTSSAPGEPFACIGDTIRNRRFARSFPVPVILGLEEQLEGSLLEHLNNAGVITMGFEGGQHDADSSVDNHEAAVWRALVGSKCLSERDCRFAREAAALLEERRKGLPQWLGIRYRHALDGDEGFVMRPGFRNFRRLQPSEVLADDSRQGEIEARYRSRILLPLYQGQGNDGFFLALDIHPWWLVASRWMRRLRMDRLVHLFPGVRRIRSGTGQEALHVDRRVARWFLVEVFHLLGYRKRRIHGEHFLVERRCHDLKGPRQIRL